MTITQAGILHLFRAGTAMADIAAACDCDRLVIESAIREALNDRVRKAEQKATEVERG